MPEYKIRFMSVPQLESSDNILTTTDSVVAFLSNYLGGFTDLASYTDEVLLELGVERNFAEGLVAGVKAIKDGFQKQVDRARVNLEINEITFKSIRKSDVPPDENKT